MSDLILPTSPQYLEFQPGHFNKGGLAERQWGAELLERQARRMEEGLSPLMAGAASFSDYAENKILDHSIGKTEFAKPTVYLALCTTVPEDGKTGTNIVEATYTGYARKEVPAGSWTAAAAGVSKNGTAVTFAACTAGTSTIIGWALVDALTVGNLIWWGTCTSTVISTTQTPATVAINAIELTLD